MQRVLYPALYWLSIYLLWTFMKSGGQFYPKMFGITLVNMPFFIAAYCLLKYLQIPLLYNRGKTILFILSLLVTAFTLSFTWTTLMTWLSQTFALFNFKYFRLDIFLIETVQLYAPGVALLAWESHREQSKEQERMRQLEKEQLLHELKYLKAQLNPHFLFQTLDQLYAAVIRKSPRAPEMIVYLSAILDYVLYKSQDHRVPLQAEVETIEHFLALEKIRHGEHLTLTYQRSEQLSAPVSPLIFLSLIKATFKQRLGECSRACRIGIQLLQQDQNIFCEIKGDQHRGQSALEQANTDLASLKRQLHIIYPNRHELTINDQATDYRVSLTIHTEP